MKPGFLAALRQTAQTGQPPVPEPRAAREQPMQPIHDQLLASLSSSGASLVQVRTVPGKPGEPSTLQRRPLGPPGLQSVQPGAKKGTIEDLFPDVPALPFAGDSPQGRIARHAAGTTDNYREGADVRDLPVPPRVLADPRASDNEDAPPPPLAPTEQQCPNCVGRGFIKLASGVERYCAYCGGNGYLMEDRLPQGREAPWRATRHRDPEPVIASRIEAIEAQERIEDALVREAAGVRPLPFPVEEDPNAEAPAAVAMALVDADAGLAPVGVCTDLERELALPGLTYDLPTNPDDLPPFCFICGPAGTGKTFWAKALAVHDPDGVTLAATTGIAAVNLGEGTTINSLLKFYDTASLRDAFTGGWLEAQLKRQRGAGLRRIILDEVSMLDGDQLTILSRAIDNVNQDRGADDAELGLILVGDFAQLPPVRASFAFESAEWERYAAATYGLTTIRRQADHDFIEALQAVRRGDARRALEFFGPRLEAVTMQGFDGTTVLAKNDAVDKYNQLRLDKVSGAPIRFPSTRWGKLRPEWGGPPKPAWGWGVPEVLSLKIGALVMVLANRNVAERDEPPEYLYVNGDLGTVLDTHGGTATVRLQRTGEHVDVIPITRENVIPLEPGRRKALKEEGHQERISANGKSEIIGACHYMPLRLAYGTTVHKSQGLSLDRVQVNIRDHFFCSPSMLYVALSRARTAEGLRIVGTPEGFRARCTVAEKVKAWL